jgi:hypothetical protein
MLGAHAALRRDLELLARTAERSDFSEPASAAAIAAGWDTFKRQLHNHHSMEDDVIWPALRQRLAASTDAISLLGEMEQEHGLIDPLLDAVDGAFADEAGPSLGDVIGELMTVLGAHLAHEERDTLPLLSATITAQEWGPLQGAIMGRPGAMEIAAEMFPWILVDAPEDAATKLFATLPPFVLPTYQSEWKPAYDAVARW